jgi:calcineurin-like phosphoesterase family protein
MLDINRDWFVTSDHHWFHQNITEFCQRPPRVDALMLERWHSVVKPRDIVLHLGDVCFMGRLGVDHPGWQQLKRLPGKKYLIRGNHDKGKAKLELLQKFGFEIVPEPQRVVLTDPTVDLIFTHRPLRGREQGVSDRNIHGHIHNNPYPSRCATDQRAWLNVSVEMTDYTPRRLGELLEHYPAPDKGWGGHQWLQGFWNPADDPEREG